jgi:hypothetical protein
LKLPESEDLGYIGMNDMIPKKRLFLDPPLPLVEEPKDKVEKPRATDVIKFSRLLGFEKGNVAEWIDFFKKVSTFQEGHCGALETEWHNKYTG